MLAGRGVPTWKTANARYHKPQRITDRVCRIPRVLRRLCQFAFRGLAYLSYQLIDDHKNYSELEAGLSNPFSPLQ